MAKMTKRGPVRGRLRPLKVRYYDYGGGEEELPAVGKLLGVPVERQEGGDIILRCPMARDGDPLRTAVLAPGRRLVMFDGPGLRFIVADSACDFMYEEEREHD